MKIKALSPWFGSNRMLAENVGAALKGCSWVGVPFAGGMCELPHIGANVMLVSDLHRHVLNLANCVKLHRSELVERLDATLFHPDELRRAQFRCETRWSTGSYYGDDPIIDWAVDYFVCSWMARNGTAGTDDEFRAGMSIRWKSGGGDSAVRFRSAVESLKDWEKTAKRCTFVCLDVFDFLAEAINRDIAANGIYLDPPFPGPGDAYKHKFDESLQRQLADVLASFQSTRIVCRFYDVPLIRELYPEQDWQWNFLKGRDQANSEKPEVLLTRNK